LVPKRKNPIVEKACWDTVNRGQTLGLVWKIERKLARLSMGIFAYCSISYLFCGWDTENIRREKDISASIYDLSDMTEIL
jgi:hypothetical protein